LDGICGIVKRNRHKWRVATFQIEQSLWHYISVTVANHYWSL